MENNNNGNIDPLNDDQDVDFSELDLADDDDNDAVKSKAQKAIDTAKDLSEKNKQLFNRAKKAEGFIIKDGKWVKPEVKPEIKPEVKPEVKSRPEEKNQLTSLDTIALVKANIHEDDIEEVIDYASFKKISISEALKSNVIKASLAEKSEQRQTAEATNTGRTRPGSAQMSGEKLLETASSTGELPGTDEGMSKMLDSRYRGKKK